MKYYVPERSKWPIIGAVALFLIAIGAGLFINEISGQYNTSIGFYILLSGFILLIFMLIGWFKDVINESLSNYYSQQMHRSFRQGMAWFITSEIMFFFVFFGALFYVRFFSVPWLEGEGNNFYTGELLWPNFIASWPLVATPDGRELQAMQAWGLPLINTIILIISSITIHIAHNALKKDNRKKLIIFLLITIILALIFLFLQVFEYMHAYLELNLKLDSGIYGNTFFMLTGFHGLHVFLGMSILIVMLFRVLRGHFNKENHFAFLAANWYWHFVDIVWLNLYIFVYLL